MPLHLEKMRLIDFFPSSNVTFLPMGVIWLVRWRHFSKVPEQWFFQALRRWPGQTSTMVIPNGDLVRPSLPLTVGRMSLASSGDIRQRRQTVTPGVANTLWDCCGRLERGVLLLALKSAAMIMKAYGEAMSQTMGVFSTWEWTPPESWQENGALHPSTIRIWILAATIRAWKRTQPLEKTLRQHLLAAWRDPGQGTQQGPGFLARGNEIIKIRRFKPLFGVICHATEQTDTAMMLSFEDLMKKKESLIREAQ